MEQGALIADLNDAIANRNCLVVVGSGVSIGATNGSAFASWTGLLRHGLQRCVETRTDLPSGWAERVGGEIESTDLDDLLSAAEKVSKKLGAPTGGEFRRWLQEGVGTLQAEDQSVLEALRDLGCPIATTNYDNLLENATGRPPITWMDGPRVERVVRGDEQGILHLHGHWQQPESVVLGIRSYERVLGNAHAGHMQRAMFTARCVLFVGCGDGLADPNIGALLAWTGQVFAESHYRRFRLAQNDEVAVLQTRHSPEQRLFVLGHGEGHASLPAFLRSLAPCAPSGKRETNKESFVAPSALAPLPPKPRCLGRADLVEALANHLVSYQPKPVPVLGPPGIGKTNLALAAAHHPAVVARFGGRRLLVRCDGAKGAADLVSFLSNALNLPIGIQNPEWAVRHALGEAPTLLIVDNTETPWEAEMVAVEALLGSLAEVQDLAMVVTLRGAQRPQLAQWHQTLEPRRLLLAESEELFTAIAGEKFRGDPHLLLLLEAVDHVPLAINLLAPLAEGEPSLAELWRRWQTERTEMLQRAGGHDRLTNLELSYELSWQGPRMTGRARQLLQRLARLPAGVKRDDLSALLPDAAAPSVSVLRQVGLAYDEGDRIRLLAPLREVVNRCHPLEASAMKTLSRKQLMQAISVAEKIGGVGGGEAALALLAESANIEAMSLVSDDLVLLNRLSGPWAMYQAMSGRGSMSLLEWVETLAERKDVPLLRATARMLMGEIFQIRSEADAAINSYAKAQAIFEQIGHLHGQAGCIFGQGRLALRRSDRKVALVRLDEALSIYKRIGDLHGQANCFKTQGDLASHRSEYGSAQALYDQALAIYKKIDDVHGQAHCIRSQGNWSAQHSDFGRSQALLDEALAIYLQIGDLQGQANCIHSQGALAVQRCDLEAAQSLFGEALAIYKQVGDLQGQARCIHDQGVLATQLSELGSARAKFVEARAIYLQIGDLQGQANCMHSQGGLARLRFDVATARTLLDEALFIYKQLDDLRGQALCALSLARLAQQTPDLRVASAMFDAAVVLFERTGDKDGLAECYRWIGQLAVLTDDFDLARSTWQQALKLAEERVDPFAIGAAHVLLARCAQGTDLVQHLQAAAKAWAGLNPVLVKTMAGWENIDLAEVRPTF